MSNFSASDYLQGFKDSFFYIYFKDLDDAIIQAAIQHVLNCPPSHYIYAHCPKIFSCWLNRAAALLLYGFGVSQDSEGALVVPPFEGSRMVSYVKRDKVREEEREMFEPKMNECTSCKDTPVGLIRQELLDYEKACYGANKGLFLMSYGVKKCKPKSTCKSHKVRW